MTNEEIIEKLGGKADVAEKLGISRGAVYLWFYPKPQGCAGCVPAKQAIKIYEMAKEKGIDCTIQDVLGGNNE